MINIMSAKNLSICLLLLLAACGLSEAFNSERHPRRDDDRALHDPEQDPPDWSPHAHHIPHKDRDDPNADKNARKGRITKRRHVRARRDQWPTSEEYVKEIFDIPTDLKDYTKPSHHSRRSAQATGYPYPAPVSFNQFPYFSPQPSVYSAPRIDTPNFYHNTLVPNGPQVNNYYLPSAFQGAQGQSNFPYPLWNFANPYNIPGVIYIGIPCLTPLGQFPPQQTPQQPQGPIVPQNPNMNNVTNRFGDGEEVPWGIDEEDPAPAPPASRPSPPRERPPMINFDQYFNTPTGISLQPVRPLRPPSRPAPPITRNNGDGKNLAGQPGPSQSRPIPTTQRPVLQAAPEEIALNSNARPVNSPDQPSNCVWAIISCCRNPPSNSVPQRCFEQMGCPGAFWDNNPCDTPFAKAASNAAKEFYTTPRRPN